MWNAIQIKKWKKKPVCNFYFGKEDEINKEQSLPLPYYETIF